MNKKNRIRILLVVLAFVVAGIVFSYAMSAKNRAKEEAVQVSEEASSKEEETEEASESPKKICVHVCGCVKTPGVYYLPEGARIHEAVEIAGGMTEEADPQYVNLAKAAEDGTQIYIPSFEEVASGAVFEQQQEEDGALVNINTAGVEELKNLPGIGEIKAEAIVAYREASGGFRSIEEIMNVAGIKENSYEKIKDYIRV